MYACPGVGQRQICLEAQTIADECIKRVTAEATDAEHTGEIYMAMNLGKNECAVVDSEGVKRIG